MTNILNFTPGENDFLHQVKKFFTPSELACPTFGPFVCWVSVFANSLTVTNVDSTIRFQDQPELSRTLKSRQLAMNPKLKQKLDKLPGTKLRRMVGNSFGFFGVIAIMLLVASICIYGFDASTLSVRIAVCMNGCIAVVGFCCRECIRPLKRSYNLAEATIDEWIEEHATEVEYARFRLQKIVFRPLSKFAVFIPFASLLCDSVFKTIYYLEFGHFMLFAVLAAVFFSIVSSIYSPLRCGP